MIELAKKIVNRVCWAALINLVVIGAFCSWRVYHDGTLILG